MMRPSSFAVLALKFLQKSMMFTPCGPSAVPTGGAGVAAPACSCTLTSAAIFFFGGIAPYFLSRGHDGAGAPATCLTLVVILTKVSRRVPQSLTSFGSAARSSTSSLSDLLDLAERQLDRGLPAEDLDEGLDPLRLRVDLGDRRVQRGERPLDHHDRV